MYTASQLQYELGLRNYAGKHVSDKDWKQTFAIKFKTNVVGNRAAPLLKSEQYTDSFG